jgi:phospholipid/cholesterol/gamma-HCH transport system substrate-binding protein
LKLTKEFKIGILVIAAMALLYWGFNFLKGRDVFTNDRVFFSVYDDVAGLQRANPVIINGLKVGQVRDMYFEPGRSNRVVIEMILKNDIAIPNNSTAKIISSDLLGSKSVEIRIGNSFEFAASGDTLESEVEASIKEEVNRQLQPLKNKAENLMSSVDTLLTMLQGLFNTSNTDNFARSVEHLANSFEHIESTTSTIDTLITGQKNRIERIFYNIEDITLNLKENQDNINHIFNNLSTISDTLARVSFSETMTRLNKTMKDVSEITQKINEGKGSLGMLVNNDTLYLQVERTSYELNLLLEDIRLNPKKYVKFSLF